MQYNFRNYSCADRKKKGSKFDVLMFILKIFTNFGEQIFISWQQLPQNLAIGENCWRLSAVNWYKEWFFFCNEIAWKDDQNHMHGIPHRIGIYFMFPLILWFDQFREKNTLSLLMIFHMKVLNTSSYWINAE